MARLTLGQAHDQARRAAAALQRLQTLYASEVTGHHASPVGTQQWKQQRLGRRHELDTLQALLDGLVAGLAVDAAAPAKLGGQQLGGAGASATAAALVEPRTGTQRAVVLGKVGRVGPLTDVQLAHATGLAANSVRPRRVELVDGGWLEAATDDAGAVITRDHNGRPHTVWRLTDAGRQALQTGAPNP